MADIRERSPLRPFPEVHGLGLRLTSWDVGSEEHVETWLRGLTDPDFLRWNTPLRLVGDRESARESLRSKVEAAESGTGMTFRITDAASGATLGSISLNELSLALRVTRVGYWVLPEARGHRVAARALALAAHFAFTDLGLHRVELGHALGHDVSCRVAERCGFRYEGTLRGAMFEAGRQDAFRDVHLHARIATDPEPAIPSPSA
ncbi:GNAT family N-acetyltransferase [Streptomyces sp. NPDC001848]|uniref:GNAT family N-acetyltransferase n=1 Tax=Streptomyces sp. NPDC001848 TaxID=3364618 RepID=UPI00368B8C31